MNIKESNYRQEMATALSSMGYRQEKKGIWLKPIGFQLLQFREDTNTIYNHCMGKNNKLLLWESRFLHKHKDFLYELKYFEAFTRLDVFVDGNSKFELKPKIEDVLDL